MMPGASVKVAGLIHTGDEWPLLALSVSHALMHHVDEVFLIDHTSGEATREGIQRLRHMWPGRLHVYRFGEDHFWQEACLNVLIEIARRGAPFDWFYVFDADEFLISREGGSLRQLLAEVGREHVAVRYEVQNWISPADFDEHELAQYGRLRYRSVPAQALDVPPEDFPHAVRGGELSFFDIPFESKIIFRNIDGLWVMAGSHKLKAPLDTAILRAEVQDLRAIHLPFLSRERLERKVTLGRRHLRDSQPPTHGWQNQMIWMMFQDGVLDEFWRTHSIPPNAQDESETSIRFVYDESFVQAVEPTLTWVDATFGGEISSGGLDARRAIADEGRVATVPMEVAVSACRRLQVIADQLVPDWSHYPSGSAAELTEELGAVYASTSWKITSPLRRAGRALRQIRDLARR